MFLRPRLSPRPAQALQPLIIVWGIDVVLLCGRGKREGGKEKIINNTAFFFEEENDEYDEGKVNIYTAGCCWLDEVLNGKEY